jgi:pentatricopeptide repeat protein
VLRCLGNLLLIWLVTCAYCKLEKLDKAVEVFREIERMRFKLNIASYNTLIAGHCSNGLLSFAIKLKNTMEKNDVHQDVVIFNNLIYGFYEEGKLHEANKVFIKTMNVTPNTDK